jgi:hypothetical protein
MSAQRQNGSSETTQAMSAFGYATHVSSSPNALLLSTRTAPVTNRRSFRPNFCCAYPPTVVFSTSACVASNFCAVELIDSIPMAGKPCPPSVLVVDCVRITCTPAVKYDRSAAVMSDVAAAP